MKRKPFIAVERIRRLSPFAASYATFCAGCGATVELVRPEEAAAIAGTDLDAVIERAASGDVHLGIRPETLLFCVNSLVASAAAPGAH